MRRRLNSCRPTPKRANFLRTSFATRITQKGILVRLHVTHASRTRSHLPDQAERQYRLGVGCNLPQTQRPSSLVPPNPRVQLEKVGPGDGLQVSRRLSGVSLSLRIG